MQHTVVIWMEPSVDAELLEKFDQKIWNFMPHYTDDKNIVNSTPMVNMTADLRECARQVYKAELPDGLDVWGKFDSKLPTGSIKVRPAAYIIREAILSGNLKSGQTIIEATSGNFGIALGAVSDMGINVISLVSRRLQEGVFEELRGGNVSTIDLDMDICPAPGMKDSADVLAAKATASNIKSQLSQMGFDPAPFDESYKDIESLLVEQDIINLAKLLGRIYGMFCTEQYDNQMNIEAHRTITAPEMDQQLQEHSVSLNDYKVFCTFGTGGTSGGISRYIHEKYGKKSVHVVFPVAGQDVAGIRTQDKADGLGLYEPDEYAEQHVIDFENARPLLKFLVQKGYDIGESSALAIYSALELAVSRKDKNFVIMIADGIGKYKKALEESDSHNPQISLDDAASHASDYDKIVWVHPQYTPRDNGVDIIARALGVDKSKIVIPKASAVENMLMTQNIPDDIKNQVQNDGKTLLVCMAGKTSLMASKVLAKKGIKTQSLNGGITNLPESMGKNPGDYIRPATD